MIDYWKKFVQFVSGFFPPSMTKKESRTLGCFRPSLPKGLVIQSIIKSSRMVLDHKYLSWYAQFAINIGLTIKMVEMSSA